MTGLVAVTGASGFVGAHCVRALAAAGWRVRMLVRQMPSAALVPDHPLETVLGTRALAMAAARLAPNARFLMVSSLAARAPHLSPYAASKRAGEACLGQIGGLREVLILRPPIVYGPGDCELLPLFRAAKAGLLPYPAPRGARLSFIHVADLASAIRALLGLASWNVAGMPQTPLEIDDEHLGGYGWEEIVMALGQAVGRNPKAFRLPIVPFAPIALGASIMVWLGARPKVLSIWKIREIYNTDWAVAGPRLSDLISGWTPSLRLPEGFAQTLDWYRRNDLIN
jgi:2-alkyl-3-oxoalkanoate reductase